MWCSSGVEVVLMWCLSGVCLVFVWLLSGVQVVFNTYVYTYKIHMSIGDIQGHVEEASEVVNNMIIGGIK